MAGALAVLVAVILAFVLGVLSGVVGLIVYVGREWSLQRSPQAEGPLPDWEFTPWH